MEERNLTKQLFSNYLRSLYIEMNTEELAWVKKNIHSVKSTSWATVIANPHLAKGFLSYYLIARECPEYKLVTTAELVDLRFVDDEAPIRALIDFDGILILRHSNTFIRNKLMFETLIYIVAERAHKNREIIVVSDVFKDSGEYVYYDHTKVTTHVTDLALGNSLNPGSTRILTKPAAGASSTRQSSGGSKPLANLGLAKLSKEQTLKNRVKSIEENSKNAI